jgi:hypothetical protein
MNLIKKAEILEIIAKPLSENVVRTGTVNDIVGEETIHSLLMEVPIIWLNKIIASLKTEDKKIEEMGISCREMIIIDDIVAFVSSHNLYAGDDPEILEILNEGKK